MSFIGDIAGPLIGGVLGLVGQKDTNEQNQEIAQNNSAFNAQQAEQNRVFQQSSAREAMQFSQGSQREQMSFQNQMSNTSYQRAVADMKTAGLNPMLAYSQGGASTPAGSAPSGAAASGSQASAVSPAPMQNKMAAAMQSAAQVAQVQNTKAQTAKTEAETVRTERETPGVDHRGVSQYQEKLWRETQKIVAEEGLTTKQKDLVVKRIQNAVKEGKRIEANTGNTNMDIALKRLQQTRERIIGHGYEYVERGIGKLEGGASTLWGDVKKAFRTIGDSKNYSSARGHHETPSQKRSPNKSGGW